MTLHLGDNVYMDRTFADLYKRMEANEVSDEEILQEMIDFYINLWSEPGNSLRR